MTRCVCFQPDRLSCRIEKVSAKDGEMDCRNTNRPVRYHGRIGFTSHERELLQQGHPFSYPWCSIGDKKAVIRLGDLQSLQVGAEQGEHRIWPFERGVNERGKARLSL